MVFVNYHRGMKGGRNVIFSINLICNLLGADG